MNKSISSSHPASLPYFVFDATLGSSVLCMAAGADGILPNTLQLAGSESPMHGNCTYASNLISYTKKDKWLSFSKLQHELNSWIQTHDLCWTTAQISSHWPLRGRRVTFASQTDRTVKLFTQKNASHSDCTEPAHASMLQNYTTFSPSFTFFLQVSLLTVTLVYYTHYIYHSVIFLNVMEQLERHDHRRHVDVSLLADWEQVREKTYNEIRKIR